MTDDAPLPEDRALYEQWRSHESIEAGPDAALDPLLLAAYLEGRLDETGAAALDALFAADPSALDDLLDLRNAPLVPEIPSAAFIRGAQALVPAPATVLPFRPRAATPRRVSPWAAWGAVAASLVLISMVGFDLGMQTERNFDEGTGLGVSIDILDQSAAPLGDGVG